MIRTTPPFEATGPICGIERKNRPVPGSHTGCSAPPVASTPWAASNTSRFAKVGGVRAQLALLTVIKVPKGGVKIKTDHPARGVGHEEAMSAGHDTVGTGLTTLHHAADHGDPFKTSSDPPDKSTGFGVDDVDAVIGTIGEIVSLGRLVDPTDVKAVQLAVGNISGGSGDRNDLEQLDGPISPCLVGPRNIADQQQGRSNCRQCRTPQIFPERSAQDTAISGHFLLLWN